jgi:hypothetical protein
MTECQHAACSDESDEEIEMRNGDVYDLCEDHAHMNLDGTAVEGYEPNNPEKFNDE